MKSTNFQSLLHSVSDVLLEEQREAKSIDIRLKKHGYGDPQPGADGHVTFTHHDNAFDQILVDVPGNEWHHMVKGVINIVGDLKDDSLEKYLGKHTPVSEHRYTMKDTPIKEHFSLEHYARIQLQESVPGTKKTYEIEASPNVIANLDRFLAYTQWCANVGHSATIGFEIDGDGADRLKVTNPGLPKAGADSVTTKHGYFELVYCSE